VKEVIREIIGQEGADAAGTPGAAVSAARAGGLSDQRIVEILAARGISLARRTVAKYRGELAIESSYSRRRT